MRIAVSRPPECHPGRLPARRLPSGPFRLRLLLRAACSDRDRAGVIRVVFVRPARGPQPDPRAELGLDIDDLLAGGQRLRGQQVTEPARASPRTRLSPPPPRQPRPLGRPRVHVPAAISELASDPSAAVIIDVSQDSGSALGGGRPRGRLANAAGRARDHSAEPVKPARLATILAAACDIGPDASTEDHSRQQGQPWPPATATPHRSPVPVPERPYLRLHPPSAPSGAVSARIPIFGSAARCNS